MFHWLSGFSNRSAASRQVSSNGLTDEHPSFFERSQAHDALQNNSPTFAPSGDATTLFSSGSKTSPEENDPVDGWQHYRFIKKIGQGGMGEVFLAFDERLRRKVAVKLLQNNNSLAARRFVSEARAQAMVDHDRLCRVYEVGEVNGRTYIVMQYVNGESLADTVLSTDEAAVVIKRVAEGLQAAHRVGLIHRDIKPGNILLERGDDGFLRPVLVDFGLARLKSRPGEAVPGIAGTPSYMSPEQSRGDNESIDRRTDIYSLGATLYRVLTGRAPFHGEDTGALLNQVQFSDPPRPRSIRPGIPADLESIVLKAMAKQPENRYDSARAMASDLNRYLEGDPVKAKTAGIWYRISKRIRKHRWLFATLALAVFILITATGWNIQQSFNAAHREKLTRQFTELGQKIEADVRLMGMAPAHDIRPGIAKVRQSMASVRTIMETEGEAATGPGYYALGLGAFALGDYEDARDYLESAWNAGFQQQSVAYTLGLTFSELYRSGLAKAESLNTGKQKQAFRSKLKRMYREPAAEWLSRGGQADSAYSSEYGHALLTFLDGNREEALRELESINRQDMWFYEVPKLKGDIHLATASELMEEGQKEQIIHHAGKSREAYLAAAEIGGSVPQIQLKLAWVDLMLIRFGLYTGEDVHQSFDAAEAALDHALSIHPDYIEALVEKTSLICWRVEYLDRQSKDPREVLARALTTAQRAVELRPDHGEALTELARVYRWQVVAQLKLGVDPGEATTHMINAFERVPKASRDYYYFLDLGNAFKSRADQKQRNGHHAKTDRQHAVDAYLQAIKLDSEPADGFINLGVAEYQMANETKDLKEKAYHLRQGLQFQEQAIARNPSLLPSYYNLGQIHRALARLNQKTRGDAEPNFQRALAFFEKCWQLNRQIPAFPAEIGLTLTEMARSCWEEGHDPIALFQEADLILRGVIEVAPSFGLVKLVLGDLHRLRAEVAARRDQDPTSSVRDAIAYLQSAGDILHDEEVPVLQAMTWLIQAQFDLQSGGDPRPAIANVAGALHAAQEMGPTRAVFWVAESKFHLLQAKVAIARGEHPERHFQKAESSISRAEEMDPFNTRVFTQREQYQDSLAGWLRQSGVPD